jgi:hypothetical protein
VKRIVALFLALGLVAVFGGVALAGGDGCGAKTHATQAGIDKIDSTQQSAVSVQDKAEADKVVVAQTDKAGKPAPETKK